MLRLSRFSAHDLFLVSCSVTSSGPAPCSSAARARDNRLPRC